MINAKKLKYENTFRVSSAGYEFNIIDDNWKISKDTNLNILKVLGFLSDNLVEGYLKTLTYFVEEYNDGYVANIFHSFNFMLNKCEVNYIDEAIILNFKSRLKKHQFNRLRCVKVFLNKWFSLNYPGVDVKVISLFKKIKIKKFGVGDSVKMKDPQKGPFDMDELQSITDATESAFKLGRININCYVMINLLMKTGRRISQLTALKEQNLIEENGKFYVSVPRIKQKGKSIGTNRRVEIDEDLWANLTHMVNINLDKINEKLGYNISKSLIKKTPIFLSGRSLLNIDEEIDISYYLNNLSLHIGKISINNAISLLPKKMNIILSRTKETLKISSVRFRYTFATMLAKTGESLESIAFALDHSGTDNVGYYVKNLPDNTKDIDKAMAKYLQSISDIFLGKKIYEGDSLFKVFISDIDIEDPKSNVSEMDCENCKHFNRW